MKKAQVCLFLLIISIVIFGCKKTDVIPEPVDPDPVDTLTAYKTRGIQVILPADTKIDLASCAIHSLSVNTKLSADGKAKAAFNTGYPNIAYVFYKDNHIILAGFLTDSTGIINTESTAKVLLYFGYATMMEQYNLTATFLNEIGKVKGTAEWVAIFDGLFKKDPMVLDKGAFTTQLNAAMHKMSFGRKMPGTGRQQVVSDNFLKKFSDLTIMNNEVKSGIQLSSEELSKIVLANNYRRRAHAFLYKVKSKTDPAKPAKEITIESNSVTTLESIVDPVGGFTSVSGVLGAWIEDKDMDFAVVKSGPVTVELEDNEIEAEYKLRIVGPGFPGKNKTISDQESSKLTRLEIETLALDFVLPVMLEIVGNKDDLALIDGSRHVTGPVEDFIEQVGVIMKILPGVYEEMRKGDYKMAARKYVEGFLDQANAAMFDNMVKLTAGVLEIIAQQKYYIPAQADVLKDSERKLKILKLIDLGLFANDLARMGVHIAKSAQLEEWTVKAVSPQVLLSPDSSTVVPLMQQEIKCEIKNFKENGGDTHPFFEWKTSGKYGKISDTKGHTNLVSFNSADPQVFYYSTATAAQLKDGDNLEYIYVTVKFGSTEIGHDTAIINVKKNRFEMQPKGVTLTGKKFEGSRNEVLLRLNKVDKQNEIGSDPNIDWKIVWSVAGSYGKLLGPGISNVTSLTILNDNTASYECRDDKTKEAKEKISAKIYMKPKGAAVSEYVLYEEVVGEVAINNDDKKKILHIPFSFLHGDTSQPYGNNGTSYRCWKGNVVTFKEDKDAKSYSVKFYDVSPVTIGAPSVISWTSDKLPGYAPASYAGKGYANGQFTLVYSWGSAQGGIPGHSNGGPKSSGMAEVTIILK